MSVQPWREAKEKGFSCHNVCRGLVELARRAAGHSPRRVPWENERDNRQAPEGRHIRSMLQSGNRESRNGSVAPSGLKTFFSTSPTAHAVGYHLPPSGLKTQTLSTHSPDDPENEPSPSHHFTSGTVILSTHRKPTSGKLLPMSRPCRCQADQSAAPPLTTRRLPFEDFFGPAQLRGVWLLDARASR